MDDVTIPDGSTLSPGSSFTKVWRLRNAGTCNWTTSYRLVFVGGDLLGGRNLTFLPTEVAPGETVDITMNFRAPIFEGDYRSNWQIRNENGEIFGTTRGVWNRPFWVDIRVKAPTVGGTTFDFVSDACLAQWTSGAGTLDCPGTDRDRDGFVLQQNFARLEDGSFRITPSLLTAPQNVFNGYIRAVYPSLRIQEGDRFKAIVNCERGATSCGVLFRVDYQLSDGIIRDFWAFGEFYEGNYYAVDLDLSSLAGQDVKFVLSILSLGSASGDRALWVDPRIERTAPRLTFTPGP